MSWLFSRALVAEYSPANCSAGEQYAPLSATLTPQQFWRNDKMMDCSKPSLFGLTLQHLTADLGEALLTSYLAASHAKTLVSPERGQDSPGREADYGQNFPALLAKYDRSTHSLKTAQLSLVEDSTACSAILPRTGMMRGGNVYLLPTVARPTYEIGSGYWQTPVADDAVNRKMGKFNSRGEPKLSAQAMIPTPTVHGNYNKTGLSPNSGDGLETFVRKWPTPLASDYKGAPKNRHINSATYRGNLKEAVREHHEDGQLNPNWVEWLMGWPLGWTDLKPLETDKFREWLQEHSLL